MENAVPAMDDAETSTRILIVDDSLADRKLCRTLIEKQTGLACEIREAEDVPSALAACELWRPDCVLLDYFLQGHVGVEWIRALKEKVGSPHLAVIMLTGLGDESVAARAILKGAADYIPKSKLTGLALDRSIRNALQKADLRKSVDQEREHRERIHQQLIDKSQELNAVYQTVSHELKTPLTAAREFVSLLLDGIGGPLTEVQQEYLEVTQDCCDRLTFLVNNWLDTVRSETGKLELNKTLGSPARLVEMSAKTYNVLADKQHIELAAVLSEDLPHIDMDVQRVEQALANLLSNAIKFSKAGDRIVVSCGTQQGELYIEVADTGRGVPEEQQAQIFKPFVQSEQEDTSKKQGMGLGLHVCNTVAELHGGRMSLVSEPNKGSRFRIWLPIASEHMEVNSDG